MIATFGYNRGCDCNLRSRVTCSSNVIPVSFDIAFSAEYATGSRRVRSRTKRSRALEAKWRRIDITRAQNRAAIFRAWRESFRQPPQPRIEKHKRIHRHSAKG